MDPTSNEEVLVVLQTENGEQIALPISALPSDFVPGDSGKIIMVESSLDDQQQVEVVVESSEVQEETVNSANDVASVEINTNPQPMEIDDLNLSQTSSLLNHNDVQIIQVKQTNNSPVERSAPRTYSKSSLVKSYAPTCGTTRIYQQPHQAVPRSSSNQTTGPEQHKSQAQEYQNHTGETDREEDSKPSITIHPDDAQHSKQNGVGPSEEEPPAPPRVKQKRKEALKLRPLNKDEEKLFFQIVEEPLPFMPETEMKRKPRKEYRKKRKARVVLDDHDQDQDQDQDQDLELEQDLDMDESVTVSRASKSRDRETRKRRRASVARQEESEQEEPAKEEKSTKRRDTLKKDEPKKELKKETPKRELPKRGTKCKSAESTPTAAPKHQQSPVQPIQTERRTRLSNACRVATGKSYKCTECDFSTDRINNIVTHVKENCPNLKRQT